MSDDDTLLSINVFCSCIITTSRCITFKMSF